MKKILHVIENCANVSLQWNSDANPNSDIEFGFSARIGFGMTYSNMRKKKFLKDSISHRNFWHMKKEFQFTENLIHLTNHYSKTQMTKENDFTKKVWWRANNGTGHDIVQNPQRITCYQSFPDCWVRGFENHTVGYLGPWKSQIHILWTTKRRRISVVCKILSWNIHSKTYQ